MRPGHDREPGPLGGGAADGRSRAVGRALSCAFGRRVVGIGAGTAVRPGPQDRPALSGPVAVASVSARGEDRHALGRELGVSPRTAAGGEPLGPDPAPGVAPELRQHRELRDREALCSPASPAAGKVATDATALRDAAGAAEPDRLGANAGAVPGAPGVAAPVRADPRILAPELLLRVPELAAEPVPRGARARLRALRRPYPRVSL